MRPAGLLVGLVSVLLTACGGRAVTARSGSDAGPEATTTAPDADVPPTLDGEVPAPVPPDASAGGGCPETLAQACKNTVPPGQFGVSCQSTWKLALADTEYCQTGLFVTQANCGQYHALRVINVDFGYTYYYDNATGELVAVVASGGAGGPNSVDCVGGPAGFVAPACDGFHQMDTCGAEAGADSGPG